ncbi:hypothetical protein PENNAL_c0445G09035, partial [Penicillium nalgiovense]
EWQGQWYYLGVTVALLGLSLCFLKLYTFGMFDDKALLKAETMDEKLEGWQGDRALRRGSSLAAS